MVFCPYTVYVTGLGWRSMHAIFNLYIFPLSFSCHHDCALQHLCKVIVSVLIIIQGGFRFFLVDGWPRNLHLTSPFCLWNSNGELEGNTKDTRKPCYRKDDRAMRHTYGCPQNFRESLATPTATFPEIVNGLLLRSIVWKCVQILKFVALPVPKIIMGT